MILVVMQKNEAMDLEYFLISRTKFVQYFYENSTSKFDEIINAIEREEEPFVPPYSEDDEPPFMEEWMDAKAGLEAVGHASLSMLSSSLHLFLKEWRARLDKSHGMTFKVSFNKGWFNAYKEIFIKLKLEMDECPANLEVIEQISLARNRAQHPDKLTSLSIHHSEKDLRRYPRPFFAQQFEIDRAITEKDEFLSWWLPPSLTTTKEKIVEAITEVGSLCSWLDSKY